MVVDNSIMAPVFQQPLALGADISMTSATKFIAGHSDVTGGLLAVKDPQIAEQIYFFQVRSCSQGNQAGQQASCMQLCQVNSSACQGQGSSRKKGLRLSPLNCISLVDVCSCSLSKLRHCPVDVPRCQLSIDAAALLAVGARVKHKLTLRLADPFLLEDEMNCGNQYSLSMVGGKRQSGDDRKLAPYGVGLMRTRTLLPRKATITNVRSAA